MPVGCDEIRIVDLYGNKKPSQLFEMTTTNHHHHHHVFTQLKRKNAGKSNKFHRAIVGGGGTWKRSDISKPIYDKKRSVIGFKNRFRFDEKNQFAPTWYMKEYRISDKIVLEDLRLHGKIRYEDFVVCSIRRKVNWDHIPKTLKPLGGFCCSSQCQETVKSSAIPSDELNSILNGHISLLAKESNVTQLPAAIQEECSVPMLHRETPSVSLLAKDDDQIPLLCDDFYIGHTNLWS